MAFRHFSCGQWYFEVSSDQLVSKRRIIRAGLLLLLMTNALMCSASLEVAYIVEAVWQV